MRGFAYDAPLSRVSVLRPTVNHLWNFVKVNLTWAKKPAQGYTFALKCFISGSSSGDQEMECFID